MRSTARAGARAVLPLVLAGGLVACTTQDPPEPDPTPSPVEETPSPEPEPEPEPEVLGVEVEGAIGGTDVLVTAGPLVTEGDLGVLPVTIEVTGGGDVSLSVAFGFVYDDVARAAPDNIRVVDTVALTVSPAARTEGGRRAVEAVSAARAGAGPVTFHTVVAAPERDEVAVLVPLVGLVAGVPVVPAGSPGAEAVERTVADVAEEIGAVPEDLLAEAAPLDSYRVVDEGTVTTRTTEEVVTVTLAADVLFAFDSAELSEAADGALRVAAAELAGVEGTLEVVGHTDDQGLDDYNLDLSRARAAAVAGRLAELADLAALEVVVDGRGSAEPAVSGRSEDARAANRRVELLFTPAAEVAERVELEGSDEPPETSGPVGTAADGVLVSDAVRGAEVQVRVSEVRVVDNVMVGTVELEPTDGQARVSWPVSQLAWDARGSFSPQLQFAATGLTLLNGRERVFPLDYVQPGSDRRRPLADLILTTPAAPGQPLRATAVWPLLAGDEVVVDVPAVDIFGSGSDAGSPWRVQEVPVVGRD